MSALLAALSRLAERIGAQNLLFVALGLLAATLVLVGLWRAARTRVGRGNARRGGRAREAEAAAEDLLERLGWEVLERQVTQSWPMEVDGVSVEASLRADLLVARDGRLFIAEVKTGRDATRPSFPSTRRQLLEYLLAFDVQGVLLVDMEREQVLTVCFPGLHIEE